MKIISKTLILLFLAIVATACNGVAPTPTATPVNIMETAISIAKTEIIMTQTAIPTATYPPPTVIPPDAYSDGHVSPPPTDRLAYAMAKAPKVYTLLPYINNAVPYGEYAGCAETNDFQNFVGYVVNLPMETVKTAFINYFQKERWEFSEAIPGFVGYDNNIPTITYDVYRISSKEITAFERLKIVLEDESVIRGENYIRVRAELTHIETKENLNYLSNPYGIQICPKSWWFWIRLDK